RRHGGWRRERPAGPPSGPPCCAAGPGRRRGRGSWSGIVKGVRSSNRRHLAIWFPSLPVERLGPARPDGPFVLADRKENALRLTAVAPEAAALGLTPGMTLADARARVPALAAWIHDPAGDAVLLERALDAFGRFSP